MDAEDNYPFVYKYHLDTINRGKARLNKDDSVTTVRIIGVPYKGRIYNVPGYDNETGKDLNEEQALKKFKKQIESGEVDSYPENFNGDIYDHPANVSARILHRTIEQDNERAKKAIGYKR